GGVPHEATHYHEAAPGPGGRGPASGGADAGVDSVDREVEDLVAAQRGRGGARGVLRPQRIVQDERHPALGDAAVGAEAMALEAGEIVVRLGGADARAGVTDDHDVALAVQRQLEALRGLGLAIYPIDAGQLA